MDAIRFGSCSWNYDSWVGLVYSKPFATAAEYLREYSRKYRSAEIDSWFYRLPDRRDVGAYLAAVDPDFRFTCKVSQDICLSHHRAAKGSTALEPNPGFLSVGLFRDYVSRIDAMLPRIDAIMLEFEYLNRDKMPSQGAFLDRLADFAAKVEKGLPVAIEVRNAPWLDERYFAFLREYGLIHVWSEKRYLPPVVDLHARFGAGQPGPLVLRLLGADRAEIEAKTGGEWNAIVDPKPERARIAAMLAVAVRENAKVIVNVNNHYEGSAPLTIAALEAEVAHALAAGPG